MPNRSAILGLLLLTAVLPLSGCIRMGQALLRFEIARDGTPVLEAYRGVWDEMPRQEVWDELDTLVFEPVAGQAVPDALAAQKQSAALTGGVTVTIWHKTNARDTVALSSLALVRRAEDQKWVLAEGEADRVRAEVK